MAENSGRVLEYVDPLVMKTTSFDLSAIDVTISNNYLVQRGVGTLVDNMTGTGIKMRLNESVTDFGAKVYSITFNGETNPLGKKGVFPCTIKLTKEEYEVLKELYDKKDERIKAGKSAFNVPTSGAENVLKAIIPQDSVLLANMREALFPEKNNLGLTDKKPKVKR